MTIYFSENLKRLRKERELTQETLADFLSVSFQAVSKWERGESYPDITMLPVIASFFGVSTDSLLGVDKAEQENAIQKYIDEYGGLIRKGDFEGAVSAMKTATAEYPGDFRLLVRQMSAIISAENTSDEGALKIRQQVQSVYDGIQGYCADDDIRMWAKRLLCTLYKRLSDIPDSGITFGDMEGILRQMPLMRNSRDYIATFLYRSSEKQKEACRNAIDELLYLLNGAVVNYCYYEEQFSTEFKLDAVNTMLTVQNAVYPDGDYGRSWLQVIYNYGHLGHLYFTAGDIKKALTNLEKSARLAKEFDGLPDVSQRTSPLMKGQTFEKEPVPKSHDETMTQRMKRFMLDKYPLTEDFKSTEEFKKIIDILN